MTDNWDVNDSDSDTDITLNPRSRNTLIKIYMPPTVKREPIEPLGPTGPTGPTFLCTLPLDLPTDIVRADSTPLEETYTIFNEEGRLSLQVFIFDLLQCRWELTEATDTKTIEAWKPFGWNSDKKILRAWGYNWIDERGRILNEYKNEYSGTKDRGWPENYYGNNIFFQECIFVGKPVKVPAVVMEKK